MPLKDRLDEELQDVVFSKEDQDCLKEQLIYAAKKPRASGILECLGTFWNGSVEIPLPAVVAVVFVLGLGLWTTYSTLLAVDQATAALFIKAGSESLRVINQGVSVLR